MEARSQADDDRETPASPLGGQHVTLAVLVAIAAVVTYVGTLGHRYVWDDHLIASQLDRAAGEGGWLKVLAAPFLPTADVPNNYYRPVVYATYWLDRAVGAAAPAVAHLSNVSWHAAASVLVFLFTRRVVGDAEGAFAGALIFAVHPVHVESVAWIAGRADILCAAFSIGAALTWGLARSRSAPRVHWLYPALTGCFFALACLSKEQAIVLPLLLLAFPYSAGSSPSGRRRLWRGRLATWAWTFIPPMLLVLLVRQAVLHDELGHTGLLEQMRGTLLVREPAIAIGASLHLLRSLIVPWPHDALITRSDVGFDAVTACSVAGLAALAWASWRPSREAVTLAAAWTGAFAIPSLLVPAAGVVVGAERYAYVPSVGLSILLGALVASGGPLRTVRAAWRLAAVTVLTAGLATAAFARSTVWADDASLTADVEATSPETPLAHVLRAEVLSNQGRTLDAIRSYRRAVALDPGSAPTQRSLGVALLQAGDPAGAAEALRRAVAAEPDWAEPRVDLGVACAWVRDWACVNEQRAALRSQPAALAALDRIVERAYR